MTYPTPPAPAARNEPVPAYPARLTGMPAVTLSRWLWLVKWVLAIPHYVVLFFLAIAMIFVTIFAFFAILFTARYPRSLFDFSVGVLRWNWRVAFYSYSALGTDVYPPFTLKAGGYPADFEVDYPDRLSRGLVLVKWWLLVIPHLLVVGALVGGGWSMATSTGYMGGDGRGFGISLLGALVIIAAVMLLFTGRYARGLFDFILGINRWTYRVIAYTALLRDEYPPFRLDQGGVDPGRQTT